MWPQKAVVSDCFSRWGSIYPEYRGAVGFPHGKCVRWNAACKTVRVPACKLSSWVMSSVMHPYCQCPFLCHSLIVTVDVIHSKYSDSHPETINVSLVRKSPKHGTGCRKECLLLYEKLLQGNNHVSVPAWCVVLVCNTQDAGCFVFFTQSMLENIL